MRLTPRCLYRRTVLLTVAELLDGALSVGVTVAVFVMTVPFAAVTRTEIANAVIDRPLSGRPSVHVTRCPTAAQFHPGPTNPV